MELLASRRTDYLRVGYFILLLLGYGFAGWLLAAFQVPWPVWLGTLAMTLHLIQVGAAALALSSGWVVGLIAIAVVVKAWARVWNPRLPLEQAQLWAQVLLLIWLGAMLLILLLAYARLLLPAALKGRWVMLALTSFVWGALALGAWLYRLAPAAA